MPTTTVEDRRCRRADRCPGRERIVTGRTLGTETCPCTCHGAGRYGRCDDDGGCGHLHTEPADTERWVGRLLPTPQGLCPTCTGKVALALDELPGLVARLSLTHLPDMAVRYRTDDISGGGDLSPPIPLDVNADALTRLIDHEVSTWAELVADAAGLPWDTAEAAASRPGHRIQTGAQLLGYRITQWLALGPQEYEARSLGEHPHHGHHPDTVNFDAGRWWVLRDGPDAALTILDLHRRAIRFTGGGPADWMPVPCGYCSSRTLHRDHHTGVVRCRTCGDTKTDDAYDAFVAAALAAHTAGVAA